MKHTITITTAALALGMALPATAANYSAAASWAETHGITVHKLRGFAEMVEADTDGDIRFEVYSGGSLLPAASMISGLRDEVAVYGHITSAYMPADMPVDNVLNDLSFAINDPMVGAFATIDVKLNNPRLQAEYNDNGVVFGTGYSMTNYYLICRAPVRSAEDLRGLRIRTGSSAHIEWAESVGAIAVSVPATEIYTGLQRGNVDCSTGDASFLTTSFQLQEVAAGVTLLPMGTHTSGGEFFNARFWADRTPEERTILLRALAQASANLQIDWNAQAEAALVSANENHNVEIIEPTPDMHETHAAFVTQYVEGLPAASQASRGVADADEVIEQFIAAQERWEALLADVDRTDTEAVAQLLWDELFSHVDVTTYGLN